MTEKRGVIKPDNIKFILDRIHKEQVETVAHILSVVKKKPYPNRNTTHLARFVHAMFQTAPFIKHPSLKKELEEKKHEKMPKKELEKPKHIPLPEAPIPHRHKIIPKQSELKVPELNIPNNPTEELKAPSPTEEKPKEYIINLFGTPIGVFIAPDKTTFKKTYHLIEPIIENKVLQRVKELIKKELKKDYKTLDNKEYMTAKVKEACQKEKVQYTEDYPRKIIYYLKRDLMGFRKIDPMMQDKNIKAIYVNGINKPVIIEFREFSEKIQSNVIFTNPEDLNILITKLARVTENEISEKKPILDTIFQGFHIQATKGLGDASSKLIIKKVTL